jgi:hypothetical protein
MEILLIDIGALAVFLGYIAIVYWHAVSHETQPGREQRRARTTWVATAPEQGPLAPPSRSASAHRN